MSKKKKIILAIVIVIIVAVVAAAVGAGVTLLILSNKDRAEASDETVQSVATDENNVANVAKADNTASKNNTTNNTTNNTSKNNTTNNTSKNNTTNNTSKNNTTNNTTNKNTTTTNSNTGKATEQATPYVKKLDFKIGSATQSYSNPVCFYTTDKTEERNLIDVGAQYDNNPATYKFYDYTVSSPDKNGNVEVSFKYDTKVPLRYKRTDFAYKGNYYYNIYFSYPKLFDYYTGDIYLTNSNNDDKSYKYNDIVYNGKTVKVGVRYEKTYSWSGCVTESENVYSDTYTATITYYVSVPKGYDGLMIGIYKNGTNQESFNYYNEYKEKYYELQKQAQETGTETKEYTEMKNKNSRMIKILEHSIFDTKVHTKDEFYVFKVKDITPIKN